MRTPPPVLPPRDEHTEQRQSWLQRHGPDSGLVMRLVAYAALCFTVSLVIGFKLAVLRHIDGPLAAAFAIVTATVLTGASTFFILKFVGAGGAIAQAITLPTGASVPYEEQFSYQESLAARGDVAGALASYEAIITERPAEPLPRLRAAELYAKGGRDVERAATLFRSVRDMPAAAPRDTLYASNRLVDLYDGPMEDPGRALVELRRIIERFPGSRAATRARAVLPRLKARLEQEIGER